MTVVQLVGCDGEFGVGVEDNEVCVAAGFQCSCPVADSGKRCRCAAHPADDVIQCETTTAALGVDDGRREREAGDSTPREIEPA